LGLRHENPLVTGNGHRCCGRIGETLVDGDALRVLPLNRCGRLIDSRLLAMLCGRNSLLMPGLAHKLAAIHTTYIRRLILATLLCIRLVLDAELDILTLNEILVAIA
jgi:hypothetical protein